MKKLISNYTFDAATRKVTLSDYTSVDLESLLLITNVTDNQIIYNFADPSFGGGITGNAVTLVYNTSSMSNTDALQIFYEDVNVNAATEESLITLQEQNLLMRRLLKMSESLTITDVLQRQRVSVDNTVTVAANNTVRPVDAINQPIYALSGNAFGVNYATIPDVWKFVDAARLNYQQAIRANITF